MNKVEVTHGLEVGQGHGGGPGIGPVTFKRENLGSISVPAYSLLRSVAFLE